MKTLTKDKSLFKKRAIWGQKHTVKKSKDKKKKKIRNFTNSVFLFSCLVWTVMEDVFACQNKLLWNRIRQKRACCLVFDTHLKAPVFSLRRSACGGLQLPASFWGVFIASSLASGKTLSLKLPSLSSQFFFFLLPSLITRLFCSICSHFSVSPSPHPLRRQVRGRRLLWGSELITCIPDRWATWGHTLPEDRSIHAGGNRGSRAGG